MNDQTFKQAIVFHKNGKLKEASALYESLLKKNINTTHISILLGNLYIQTEASGEVEAGQPGQNGFGVIQQGYLEMSNVNVVEEMVNMIIAQRAYEVNSKSIQTSDDMLSRVNQLKR